jgi:nucleoside-diphosphate-sugar epimerase
VAVVRSPRLLGLHFYQEDCRDYFRRRREAEFDYALHLAAMVGGRTMIENDPLAVAEDLSIDAAYWQWAKTARPGKTVCFSSSAAYPIRFQQQSGYRLLTEDMIDFVRDLGVPDFSYGWAKLTCEYLARVAYERHGRYAIGRSPVTVRTSMIPTRSRASASAFWRIAARR